MDNIAYYFGEYPNKKALEKITELRTPPVGAIAYCKDSKTYYEYKDYGGWSVKLTNSNSKIEMSIYDMNSQIIAQLPDADLEEVKAKIDNYASRTDNGYYMFLCKEQSYFTVFSRKAIPNYTLGDAVIECASDLGKIKAIDTSSPNEIEVWVMFGTKADCIHLFPYDLGIVTFGG